MIEIGFSVQEIFVVVNKTEVPAITKKDANKTEDANKTDVLGKAIKGVPLDFVSPVLASLKVKYDEEKTTWSYAFPGLSSSVKSLEVKGLYSFMDFNSVNKLLAIKCDKDIEQGSYNLTIKLIGKKKDQTKKVKLTLKIFSLEDC